MAIRPHRVNLQNCLVTKLEKQSYRIIKFLHTLKISDNIINV